MRPGQGGHPYGGGACPPQGLRSGPGRCPGGKNVVDNQNVLEHDGRGVGDRECAAHINAALPRCQAGLAIGSAKAHERARGQGKAPFRVAFAKEA